MAVQGLSRVRDFASNLLGREGIEDDPDPPSPLGAASEDPAASGYYLGNRHELIHRHHEAITISPDQTGRWQLTIDLELPKDAEAAYEAHDGESNFIFPLFFLKKTEGRTGFGARDEAGKALTLANRRTCNKISAGAATNAANRLLAEQGIPELPEEHLQYILECVTSWRPYGAAVILNELLARLRESNPEIIEAWEKGGFIDDLEMLADHSLVWTPLRGRQGERRSIDVRQDLELLRRPLLRWNLGELNPPRWPRLRRRKARKFDDRAFHLNTGAVRYGRKGLSRISFSVLGERLAQPLAWMPIEFDFPTIYTRRCSSYHFELICPRGLSPRGIKLATSDDKRRHLEGRTILGTRAAEVYLPSGRSAGDVMFRATVGVGHGAFPVLWFLMGAITATMLWVLAGTNPTDLLITEGANSRNEIAAGILLIVPALVAAVVISSEDEPVTQLLGGARILLLVVGLCAVAAATVLIEARPFGEAPRATWTICATVATAAMIPLATSWLLSLRWVWRGLQRLNKTRLQYAALMVLLAIAAGMILCLEHVHDGFFRGLLAISLVMLSIPLILLASNRLAVPLNSHRFYVSLGALIAAIGCVAVGCVEMRGAIDPMASHHEIAEHQLLYLLPAALAVGPMLTMFTWPARQMGGEAHIAPAACKLVIAGERIRDLPKLRSEDKGKFGRLRGWRTELLGRYPNEEEEEEEEEIKPTPGRGIERGVVAEPVANTEADWSSGVRSTVKLPPYEKCEFDHFCAVAEEDPAQSGLDKEEREMRRLIRANMDALRTASASAIAGQ
jgi:hypothetical protein